MKAGVKVIFNKIKYFHLQLFIIHKYKPYIEINNQSVHVRWNNCNKKVEYELFI